MEELMAKMNSLEVTGSNLKKLLELVADNVQKVRTAKLGTVNPGSDWLEPISASNLTVNRSKLMTLNAKRRVGDHVDRLLLDIVRLQEATTAAQHLAYKHRVLKTIRAQADNDIKDDTSDRREAQDAILEARAKRQEALAKRKRRRIEVQQDDDEEEEINLC